MRSQCSLVLSGHTHAPNIYSWTAAHARNDLLTTSGTLTVSSAGTLGGLHPANDRRRAFNILDFSQVSSATSKRTLSVRTFCYDGVERTWRGPETPYTNPALQV